MRVVSARLSKILAEAESLHSAAEAGFLSDIAWLTDEFDALDLPSDQAAVWRARIGILRDEVFTGAWAISSRRSGIRPSTPAKGKLPISSDGSRSAAGGSMNCGRKSKPKNSASFSHSPGRCSGSTRPFLLI